PERRAAGLRDRNLEGRDAPGVVENETPAAVALPASDVGRLPGDVERVAVRIRAAGQRPLRIDDCQVAGRKRVRLLDAEVGSGTQEAIQGLANRVLALRRLAARLGQEHGVVLVEFD